MLLATNRLKTNTDSSDEKMKNYPTTIDNMRKRTMSRIKSNNTSIEVTLRKALWHAGIRYRKNYSLLPGKPDIVLTKYRIAIFCDGEFWHGKDWERKKHRIKTNRDYWIRKIERNIDRDNDINRRLHSSGWTVIRFWGNDINDNVEGCVADIKDAIFQSNLDAFCDSRDISEHGYIGNKPNENDFPLIS